MVDIQPFLNTWAYPVAALVLAGFVAWLLARSSAWLNAHAAFLTAQTRANILKTEKEALEEGANYVMTQLQAKGANAKVSINDPVVRFGAQIAMNHAAGTLASNGADPEEVAAKILTLLGPAVIAVAPPSIVTKSTTVTTETVSAAKPT